MEIVSNLKAASERLLCVVDSHGPLSATTYCPSIYYDGHKHRILQRNASLVDTRCCTRETLLLSSSFLCLDKKRVARKTPPLPTCLPLVSKLQKKDKYAYNLQQVARQE